jgi:hypothetical protein
MPQEDAIFTNGTIAFTNYILGITPVCFFNSSDADNTCKNMALPACFIWHMLTNHFYTCSSFMYSFSYPNDFMKGGLGPFLAVVSIIAITIYFITSSNSGSLIVDHLASNGNEEHHWLQQLFWALPEGAVASALLASLWWSTISTSSQGCINCCWPSIYGFALIHDVLYLYHV